MKEVAVPDTKNHTAKKEVDMHASPLKSTKLIKRVRFGMTMVPTFCILDVRLDDYGMTVSSMGTLLSFFLFFFFGGVGSQ